MNRNVLFLALVIGGGIYLWQSHQPGPTSQAPVSERQHETPGDVSDQLEQTKELLAETKRQVQQLKKAKEDAEYERLNAELDQRVEEYQRQQDLDRAQQQARKEQQLQEWKGEFNERADRRAAWEDYNASKDAVSEVLKETGESYQQDDNSNGYLFETPKQTLRRSYGDSATLEQNELK